MVGRRFQRFAMPRTLPIQLKLEGRHVILVGGGELALPKARILVAAGARLGIVAPASAEHLPAMLELPGARYLGASLRASMLAGVAFVLAASGERDLDRRAAALASRRGIPCNVVDDAILSSAHWPAVVRRGPLQVAVSSGGQAPALAALLRSELEAWLGPEWAVLGEWLSELNPRLRQWLPTAAARRRFLSGLLRGAVGAALRARRFEEAKLRLHEALAAREAPERGSVVLVGAGPGDPELLTVAALRELGEADAILYDRLVPPAILELARADAERIAVGRRCGEPARTATDAIAHMIELARRGLRVVRLKAGDPMLFARAAEELTALAESGIPYRIVPGVTAALAAAAHAAVPLTWRGRARSVLLATAHDAESLAALRRLRRGCADTLVIYMGLSRLEDLVRCLLRTGWQPATPAVIVAGASLPDETIRLATLDRLPLEAAAVPGGLPTTLIVGEVAALASRLSWRGQLPPSIPIGRMARRAEA